MLQSFNFSVCLKFQAWVGARLAPCGRGSTPTVGVAGEAELFIADPGRHSIGLPFMHSNIVLD